MDKLISIGVIYTPYKKIEECPDNTQNNGPIFTLEIKEEYSEGLIGLDKLEFIEIFYWLDQAQRDLLVRSHGGEEIPTGIFALRSPHRPNPIGSAVVKLVSIKGNKLSVRGLDCLDGTRLLDIKRAKKYNGRRLFEDQAG